MVKDLAKRRRVMQRSMQLGHCICDPRKPCPCDLLIQEDLCPCAGEARPLDQSPIRLTEWAENSGCASKIDQATLQRILAGLSTPADPRVLVGMPAGDDAGVYLLDERTALVQTVDVFTPPVDDPYAFGQIAAANSLSDVYAMGGRPITALSIVGFPAGKLPDDVLRQILRGGLDKMTEAGVAVIGGHSIKENEIKAGFAVTGLIDPGRLATNAAARPGDRLVLTKPLGTGIIAFAARIGRASPESIAAAVRAMTALNRRAAELMGQFEVHACTDVTGFGLLGHLKSMAAASRVDVELAWDDLPLLPGVLESVAAGIVPGAVERNRESSGDALAAVVGVDPAWIDILFDAQTSGGLLISLPQRGCRDIGGAAACGRDGRGLGGGPGGGRGNRADIRGRPTWPDGPAGTRGDPDNGLLRRRSRATAGASRGRRSSAGEVPGVFGSGQRARHAGRANQAGDGHCLVGAGPLWPLPEASPPQGEGGGFLARGNRRSRLDGHRLRRLAGDDVLQRDETVAVT